MKTKLIDRLESEYQSVTNLIFKLSKLPSLLPALELINSLSSDEYDRTKAFCLGYSSLLDSVKLAECRHPGVHEILLPGLVALRDSFIEVGRGDDKLNALLAISTQVRTIMTEQMKLLMEIDQFKLSVISTAHQVGIERVAHKEQVVALASKAGHASHRKTDQIKANALADWHENGRKYSTRTAYARLLHKEYDVAERTLYKWITEEMKKNPCNLD